MIHIVFNQPDEGIMQEVLQLDETLAGEVIFIKDDFAVGPLQDIDQETGWQARVDWWRMLLQGSPYGTDIAGSFDDRETVNNIIAKLEENTEEQAWIWMGQNQHDVCGYYWLLPFLKAFQGRVLVLYMNNLPFINEKGHIFYPTWLSEIRPAEFLKAKKLARPVTLSEFETDPDEWARIVQENAYVRILEGGKKIVGKAADFYDHEIMKNLTGDWQKAWRVIANTFNRMKIKTGDVYIGWRLKELIRNGKVAADGDMEKDWKSFDVKLFSNTVEEESESVKENNQ